MASIRLRRPGRPMRRQSPFTPIILALEDRTVPSTFYVDPSWAGSGSFSTQTFNNGYPGQKSGIIYGADLTDYTASPTTVNGFSDLDLALQVSEQNPGADTILVARSTSPISLNNSATFDDGSGFQINSVPITQPLTLSGSGAGATIITPLINTQSDGTDDDTVGLFRVAGAAANLNVSGLTLNGTGHKLGAGFLVRDGATATFDGITIRNVAFDVGDGTAIVGFEGGTTGAVNVQNSEITGYGRSGVVYQDTNGKVTGATIVGSGQTDVINNGVEVLDNSTVLITGSTISANLGRDSGADSAGVLVSSSTGTTAHATLLGNSIYDNAVGLLIGEDANDASVVVANYNNIAANDVGVDNTLGTNTVDARNNFWGSASGPFESGSNPTGAGNPVKGLVNFLPTLAAATPAVSTTSTTDYLTQIATIGTNVAPAAGQSATIAHPATSADSVSFTVTFAQAVTGFGSEDVTVTGAAVPAGGATVSVTGTGTTYTVTVTGLSGAGAVNVAVKPNGATGPLGFQNAASNTATVTFAGTTISTNVTATTASPVAHTATAADVVTFAVTFGQSVSGFDASDVTVTGGIVPAAGANVTVSGSGASYTVSVSGLSGTGTVSLSVKAGAVTGTGGATNAASNTASVTFNPNSTTVVRVVAVAPDTGGQPFVQVYNADGSVGAKFLAFEASFTGGVRVATGDVNGDGVEDIIVGAGVGGGPRVRVFSGVDQSVLADFFAYESTVRDGTYVAAGDLDGDGKAEVITGAGIGGAPAVAVFGYDTTQTGAGLVERYRFFAFENTARGGVTVAAADVNGDGKAEIVAGAGVGGAPAVAVFNGNDGSERYRLFAFSSEVRTGVYVAAGDLNGDGKAEIVAGAGVGGGPQVRVINGADGSDLGSFFAYDSSVRGGVRVAVGDITGDGVPDVITGPGPGGAPNVKAFDPLTSSNPVFSTFAFDTSFTGGVYVG